MVKDKKLFHKLLDIVLDKDPESGADMNVSSLKYTASVWLMNVDDGKVIGAKEYYTRVGDETWAKTKDGKTKIVRDEDVLEALRNA